MNVRIPIGSSTKFPMEKIPMNQMSNLGKNPMDKILQESYEIPMNQTSPILMEHIFWSHKQDYI